MARQFDPKFAFGFEGDIVYELSRTTNGRPPDRWTIRVAGDSAEALPGADGNAAVTLRLSVADFARVAAEEVDAQELIFSGRFDIEGDLHVAGQLQEMFGGPARF
jgi:ubiquinone biosynthesis protein UbiJ